MIQPTYGGIRWNAHYISAAPLLSIRPSGERFVGAQLMYNHTLLNEVRGVVTKGNRNRTMSIGGHFLAHGTNSYAGGLRFLHSLFIGDMLYPHIGANTDIFSEGGRIGLNFKPEAGLTFFLLGDIIGFKTSFTYGYNFSPMNGDLYTPRRHELTFDLGILIAISNDFRDNSW